MKLVRYNTKKDRCVQPLIRMSSGTTEEVVRYTKRTVRVTQQHNDECKRLLKLMGIPYVEVRRHITHTQQLFILNFSLFCDTGAH